MRRMIAALVTALAALPLPAGAAVPVLVVEGRGFGHGVGMAQDGAFWMARQGQSTEKILAHFYPGTRAGRAGGDVRVPVLDAGSAAASITLAFPDGGEVRAAPGGGGGAGFPVAVPAGGEARISFAQGRYRVEAGRGREQAGGPGRPARAKGRTAAPGPGRPAPPTRATVTLGPVTLASARRQLPPLPPILPPDEPLLPPDQPLLPPADEPLLPPLVPDTTAPPAPPTSPPGSEPARASSAGPLWAVPAGGGTVALPARQRRYRGMVEVTAATGTLRAVNQLDVEQYLKGMGEVLDPSWPPAALRAQAVAARTYALRAMAAAGEVCETQRCQVYLGAQVEYGAMNKAVDATAGRVLLHGRGLASTVYSANGGGHSASQEEGFGVTGVDVPYLRPAPYPTQDPGTWTVRVALRDVKARFGYPGQLTGVEVSRRGPSGRAVEVALTGTKGRRVVSGLAFDAGLGLRSTLFDLRLEQAATAPPPPKASSVLQALPDGLVVPAAEPAGGPAPAGPAEAGPTGSEATPIRLAASGNPDRGRAGVGAGDGLRAVASVVGGWSLLGVLALAAVLRPRRRADAPRPALGQDGPGAEG